MPRICFIKLACGCGIELRQEERVTTEGDVAAPIPPTPKQPGRKVVSW